MDRFIIPVFAVLLGGYFIYHANVGKHGWEAREKLGDEVNRLEFRVAGLVAEREMLEKRVGLLRNGSLERDMLDEQARYQLNLLHRNEIVIMSRSN